LRVEEVILAIGYGNWLRRDDGAGLELLRMVEQGCAGSEVRCIEAQQLLPEMAAEMASPEVTGVIFLDARPADSGGNGEEGARVTMLTPLSDASSLGHHLTPETLLAYAWKLYGRTLPAWLVTVPGEDFGHGEGFSEGVKRSLPAAWERTNELLRDSRKRDPGTLNGNAEFAGPAVSGGILDDEGMACAGPAYAALHVSWCGA
jgi:hydrogenase maturation protease